MLHRSFIFRLLSRTCQWALVSIAHCSAQTNAHPSDYSVPCELKQGIWRGNHNNFIGTSICIFKGTICTYPSAEPACFSAPAAVLPPVSLPPSARACARLYLVRPQTICQHCARKTPDDAQDRLTLQVVLRRAHLPRRKMGQQVLVPKTAFESCPLLEMHLTFPACSECWSTPAE